MKINLLYVITKLELGGAQTQLLSLIKGLDKDQYNVFLFTAERGVLVEEAVAIPSLNIHRSKWMERSIHPIKDLFAFLEVFHFIREKKIDIVHTHSSKAGILGRWAAYFAKTKRILHTVHGWSFNDFQRAWVRNFCVWLEKITAQITDQIIVVSEHDKQKGLNCQIGNKAQYHLVRYGIEKTRFETHDRLIRKELGIHDQVPIVGTIACLKPQKAPEDFVQLAFLAQQALPEARFLLIGDGELRGKIEKKISELGLNFRIILTGWRRDIPRLLSAMDVFVLTSLWEGLPIAVLEAMAAGVPVIATHTGGVAEVVRDGKEGFLVPCHDISFMLKRVVELLGNTDLREQIARDSKNRLDERFSVEMMIKNSEFLYQDFRERWH